MEKRRKRSGCREQPPLKPLPGHGAEAAALHGLQQGNGFQTDCLCPFGSRFLSVSACRRTRNPNAHVAEPATTLLPAVAMPHRCKLPNKKSGYSVTGLTVNW